MDLSCTQRLSSVNTGQRFFSLSSYSLSSFFTSLLFLSTYLLSVSFPSQAFHNFFLYSFFWLYINKSIPFLKMVSYYVIFWYSVLKKKEIFLRTSKWCSGYHQAHAPGFSSIRGSINQHSFNVEIKIWETEEPLRQWWHSLAVSIAINGKGILQEIFLLKRRSVGIEWHDTKKSTCMISPPSLQPVSSMNVCKFLCTVMYFPRHPVFWINCINLLWNLLNHIK